MNLMSLRRIKYKQDYRSGNDDIVSDLFKPSLKQSQNYFRAVGYFSSSALEAFGSPLGEFVKRGGSIKLVTSVELAEADLEAIHRGASRERICQERLGEIIDKQFADGIGDGVARLVMLLELGRLEIRIAIPTRGSGIYHEKIGIFDDGKDYVAFSGSSNESRNALENNRECIDVYPSWSSAVRAERKRNHFNEVWEGQDKGVKVYGFPDALKRKLIRIRRDRTSGTFVPTVKKKKWRHQDKALDKFVEAERGILNMATGTGKTRTALNIFATLFEKRAIDTAIVCTDGKDLLPQWYSELLRARGSTMREVRVLRHHGDWKQMQDFVLDPKDALLIISRIPLASALKQLTVAQCRRMLIIHDEVHGLGSTENRNRLNSLADPIRFRLGLSATPERPYDDVGNQFIEDQVGPVLMTFGLKKAIQRGILAPFNYHPLAFAPTEDDSNRVAAVYRRKKARELDGEPMSEAELRIAISSVYKTSEAKLPIFEAFIERNQELLERSIVFVETMAYGQRVLEIVHRYRPDFHTYFTGEDQATLDRFAEGSLECLITCHRLSEGIDIKSLNTVILFSSERGQLETIQRMGRCLRTNPDDPEKIAHIVDFIRDDNKSAVSNSDQERCTWLTELSKIRPEE